MTQTYKTIKEARAEAKKMVGWKIKIIKDANGMYIIQCNAVKHLHTDGYVR